MLGLKKKRRVFRMRDQNGPEKPLPKPPDIPAPPQQLPPDPEPPQELPPVQQPDLPPTGLKELPA
jgi:hypothetical protein